MADALQPFYTAEVIGHLEAAISPERLAPYVLAAGGDTLAGIRRYERNTLLSEALYGVVQGLEVPLRNSIHRTLAAAFGVHEWYDAFSGWGGDERKAIGRAKKDLAGRKRPVTAGRVIAELSFGFWVALAEKRYSEQLWVPHLHTKRFPEPNSGEKPHTGGYSVSVTYGIGSHTTKSSLIETSRPITPCSSRQSPGFVR